MVLGHLEKQFTLLREQLYYERINQVDNQLTEIRGGRSQEYLAPLQRLNDNLQSRTEVAAVMKRYRMENIMHKFLSEEQAAEQHFQVCFVNFEPKQCSTMQTSDIILFIYIHFTLNHF